MVSFDKMLHLTLCFVKFMRSGIITRWNEVFLLSDPACVENELWQISFMKSMPWALPLRTAKQNKKHAQKSSYLYEQTSKRNKQNKTKPDTNKKHTNKTKTNPTKTNKYNPSNINKQKKATKKSIKKQTQRLQLNHRMILPILYYCYLTESVLHKLCEASPQLLPFDPSLEFNCFCFSGLLSLFVAVCFAFSFGVFCCCLFRYDYYNTSHKFSHVVLG